MMNNLSKFTGKARMKGETSYILFLFAISVALIMASRLISPSFGSFQQAEAILILSSLLVLVGLGQGLVILLGELDLSVASLITLSGVLTTAWLGTGNTAWWSFPLILIILALIGVVNGLGVTLLRIPSFIMTLATQMVVTGAILGFTKGTTAGMPPAFLEKLMTSDLGGIPLPVYVLVLVAIVGTAVQKLSKFGRQLYAVGSNRTAAKIAGLPVTSLIVCTYAISALCAGLTGMMLVGYAGGASLNMGESYLLPSIAAVVIGGTSIAGGSGNYMGTIGAAILLTTVSTIIQALGISQGWQTFIYGFMIAFVLGFLRKDIYAFFFKAKAKAVRPLSQ
ncbi:ABC transporter permease [Paenibacillus sp. sgz302251]|uniref:ABC transporter permease n=1 Tax=Paenibacillus sp. sgz302251 TaxID=3414493 RepID=UPI003C7CD162